VSDFGLACALPSADNERFACESVVVGTPVFMAPEVLSGSVDRAAPGPVYQKADVYSAALSMYEFMMGELPFDEAAAEAEPDEPPQITGPPVPRFNVCTNRLLFEMMREDYRARPTAQEALDRLVACNPEVFV